MDVVRHIQDEERFPACLAQDGLKHPAAESHLEPSGGNSACQMLGVQLLPAGKAACPELWEQGQILFQQAKLAKGMQHHDLLLKAGQKFADVVLAPGFFPEEKSYALNNLGLIMQALGYLEKANKAFAHALTMNPTDGIIMQNFATIRMCMDDWKGADEWLHKALEKNPTCAEARWNLSLIALFNGDFKRGFALHEWRWRCGQFTWRRLKTCRPSWNGQDLKGKTILLTHEQGFGDSIMMIRYAKMVKARGAARVRYLCLPELVCILKDVEGIDDVTPFADINLDGTAGDEDFDYHVPLMSLPRIFKTRVDSVPWDGPYVKGNWGFKGKHMPGLRIGIVWAGRAEHGNDKNRSMRFQEFEPLFDLPGINWYSLQFGARAKDNDNPKVYAPTIETFADTAWWLNELDLLISVDTGVVHLAGAMGRPVWNLVSMYPDWRWMLDRDDSPWYPTMKLWRQKTKGDWAEVIQRVKDGLRFLV